MMRQPFLKAVLTIVSFAFVFLSIPNPAVNAGFFDRMKDIYNTPEKISELESQYLEAKAALAEQQRQLEDSRRAAEQYARKQQELQAQNEQLLAQNASLQNELDQMKQDRASFVTKLIYTGIILTILIVSYILSIRIWRYVVWRKQRTAGGRGLNG
ncbi:hypothetical protein [Paenibacillus harenae]|uniref:hypothetical protein n=1 Tax=Paenibacillus harenae TaxID=306543 RepID=UPI0004041271|nr:hypothetical protein [Paenibacillus harenae]